MVINHCSSYFIFGFKGEKILKNCRYVILRKQIFTNKLNFNLSGLTWCTLGSHKLQTWHVTLEKPKQAEVLEKLESSFTEANTKIPKHSCALHQGYGESTSTTGTSADLSTTKAEDYPPIYNTRGPISFKIKP